MLLIITNTLPRLIYILSVFEEFARTCLNTALDEKCTSTFLLLFILLGSLSTHNLSESLPQNTDFGI